MSKLTPWFPGHIKPLRVGVYERQRAAFWTIFSYWDGKRWGFNHDTAADALRDRKFHSYSQGMPWRGLASDPGVTS
jgi:hypothetical protein